MENEKEEPIYYNLLLAYALCIVFFAFKLTACDSMEEISWWWILLPLWLPFPLSFLIYLIKKLF